jgi:hypothetical protein
MRKEEEVFRLKVENPGMNPSISNSSPQLSTTQAELNDASEYRVIIA